MADLDRICIVDPDAPPGWVSFHLDRDIIVFKRSDETYRLPLPPDEHCRWRADSGSLFLEEIEEPCYWYCAWELPGGELHCNAPLDMALFFIDALRQYWNHR